MFIKDYSRNHSSYLVIHDGIGQFLDKPSQGCGVVNITQEPNKRVLLRERIKLRNYPLELPERGISKLIYIRKYERTSEALTSSPSPRNRSC